MEVRKIMVTGAGGFLGSRIAAYYSKSYDVAGITRNQMDFVDAGQVCQVMEKECPDVVIHCGAVSDVGRCAQEPEYSGAVNVTGTENIARACEKYQAKMVFCSSDQVYFGAEGMLPHREDEKLCPPHVYGRQKLLAERQCLKLHPESVVLRLSWMYDMKIREGQEHGNFLSEIQRKVEAGEKLCYPVYDYRSITNVWEVVSHMEKAWKMPAGIYNFGSGNNLSTYDLVVYLMTLRKEDSVEVVKNMEAFAENPRNLRMDLSKVEKQGIVFTNTAEGLEKIIIHK